MGTILKNTIEEIRKAEKQAIQTLQDAQAKSDALLFAAQNKAQDLTKEYKDKSHAIQEEDRAKANSLAQSVKKDYLQKELEKVDKEVAQLSKKREAVVKLILDEFEKKIA